MDRKHLYIVDDSKTILKLTEGVLIGSYRISLFLSGKEALEAMHTDTPDLVLLDINMPEMDGYEVFRRMKDSNALRKIPVIFLTASTKEESEVKGLEMGAMDYISKPFSPMVMQQRIARIIGKFYDVALFHLFKSHGRNLLSARAACFFIIPAAREKSKHIKIARQQELSRHKHFPLGIAILTRFISLLDRIVARIKIDDVFA